MVSLEGVAVGVALTLLAVVVDAYLSRDGGRRGSQGTAGERTGSHGEGTTELVDGDEDVRWTTARNVRGEFLVGVASALLAGVPVGLVSGLFLWLVAGLLPGEPPTVRIALGVVGGVAPTAWLLLSRDRPSPLDPPAYAVTDGRLLVDGGDPPRRPAVPLEAVEDVTVASGRIRNRLGVGTVAVAATDRTVAFDGVRNPEAFAAAVEDAVADTAEE